MYTKQELQNIAVLLKTVNITGEQAIPVAMLIQKTNDLIAQADTPKEEPKKK